MEYLPQHILAALVLLVCGSVAATTADLLVRVLAAVMAVAMPVAIEVSVRNHKRACADAEDRR
jgi:hypothetical protein